ncbi:DUF5916 domain-containing protein [Microscilla marina]|uniref:DUF5916 domain-containing protein n=1 Tax=Microscilla marina TaxID=1027 RepID=UPI0005D46E99|nr:DUF5916 domain-containing protein [Microscilla marina]
MKTFTSSFLCVLLCCGGFLSWAKPPKTKKPNSLKAVKIKNKPTIDGKLDDEVWVRDPSFYVGNFIQTRPSNGKPSAQKTEIKVIYDDFAIYISAKMYDSEPNKILKEFGQRDSEGKNSDYFSVSFDTYNKQQNAFSFIVSAAGVQTDKFISARNEDVNWNAVWKSAVKITDEGWTAELEIPYSALRFPRDANQTWGVNFMRRVQRNQETSYWNHVDASLSGFVNQFGQLTGLKNIKPPVRLFLLPYASFSSRYDDTNGNSNTYGGGMDLKYGISESFTLDMSLVPDFSQVQSDNVVLNLSPFEVRFQENRPFFTEGTELFNKGGLFYSRRVGQSSFDLKDELGENEEVDKWPGETQLINATKLSGRTKGGLGIGIFNAVTKASYARVKDTETGETRTVLVDPLTNYNTFVLDQNLPNNSNISFINTNVSRAGGFTHANVTGTDFRFHNKKNTYRLQGFAAVSQRYTRDSESGSYIPDLGYKYNISFSKVRGKFRFWMNRNVESDNYNPNDMGFLQAPNEVSHNAEVGYMTFKPKGILNRFNWWTGTWHRMLYKPFTFNQFGLWTNMNFNFTNFWYAGFNLNTTPVDNYDYFSPRVEGRFFKRLPAHEVNFWAGTDSRKKFRLTGYGGTWARPDWKQQDTWFGIRPRYRVNNKLSFIHDFNYTRRNNERNWATNVTDDNDHTHIVYGRRDVRNITNTFTLDYAFNRLTNFRLRIRHYWSNVIYDKLYLLQQNGELLADQATLKSLETNSEGVSEAVTHNQDFNAFNIDFVFNLQFAPGSFLTLVYKNAVSNFLSGREVNDFSFERNFRNNVMNAPQVNTFSAKVIYFLDYLYVKKLFK